MFVGISVSSLFTLGYVPTSSLRVLTAFMAIVEVDIDSKLPKSSRLSDYVSSNRWPHTGLLRQLY